MIVLRNAKLLEDLLRHSIFAFFTCWLFTTFADPLNPFYQYAHASPAAGSQSEVSIMEWTQNLILFAAACLAVKLAWGRPEARSAPRHVLIGAAALFLLMVGEEMSWGQHIFAWATPDWLAPLNQQDETNFHNVAGWDKERIVRVVLMGLTPLAAGALPLWAASAARPPLGLPGWTIPLPAAAPWSLCVLVTGVAMKGRPAYPTGAELTLFQYSEVQELCLYVLGLICVAGLAARPDEQSLEAESRGLSAEFNRA